MGDSGAGGAFSSHPQCSIPIVCRKKSAVVSIVQLISYWEHGTNRALPLTKRCNYWSTTELQPPLSSPSLRQRKRLSPPPTQNLTGNATPFPPSSFLLAGQIQSYQIFCRMTAVAEILRIWGAMGANLAWKHKSQMRKLWNQK